MIDEQKSHSPEELYSIARLVQIGRGKGCLTTRDILSVFPHPEQNLDQLDLAFATLNRLGIPYELDGEIFPNPKRFKYD